MSGAASSSRKYLNNNDIWLWRSGVGLLIFVFDCSTACPAGIQKRLGLLNAGPYPAAMPRLGASIHAIATHTPAEEKSADEGESAKTVVEPIVVNSVMMGAARDSSLPKSDCIPPGCSKGPKKKRRCAAHRGDVT